jgi:ABC-type multidrug transport system fused ATPase/permease subunit
MKTLRKLLDPIKYFKRHYFWYIVSAWWYGAFRPTMWLILSKIIKGMEIKDFALFKTYMILFLALTAINYIVNYFFRTSRRITTRLFQDKIYNTYLSKYLKADNNKIETLWTGQSNSILQKWCDSRKDILHSTLISSIMSNIIKIATVLIIVIMNLWRTMFVIIILLFIIIIFFARRGNKRMKPIRDSRREVYIQTDRFIIKVIMSKFEILQNNKIIKELKKARNFFYELIWRDIKESKWFILASDFPRALLDFAKGGILFRYGIQIFNGNWGIAEFALIWTILNQITWTLFELNDIMLNYFWQIPFVEKLRKTFDDIPKLRWYEEGKIFKLHEGQIILDKVYFNYGDKNVLQNFSLHIQWGKKTAFVGESGSGKTTLLKLISWYVHPDKGNIIVDDQILSTVALKEYYKHIWYLTQDPNVFDGTIRDNLLYGTVKKPTKKQIDEAIKLSRCEFIKTFKDGLQTQIGEKWIRLSWGQKQRLAIAKLFLKNPKIIFLDEPTSSLDSFSEEDIAHAFTDLFKWRTVIVVAHRLQTVKQADIIHVLNKGGKIVESGTHQELLEKKWIYYRMIELQSGF